MRFSFCFVSLFYFGDYNIMTFFHSLSFLETFPYTSYSNSQPLFHFVIACTYLCVYVYKVYIYAYIADLFYIMLIVYMFSRKADRQQTVLLHWGGHKSHSLLHLVAQAEVCWAFSLRYSVQFSLLFGVILAQLTLGVVMLLRLSDITKRHSF